MSAIQSVYWDAPHQCWAPLPKGRHAIDSWLEAQDGAWVRVIRVTVARAISPLIVGPITISIGIATPIYGGACRHCGGHDEYPELGSDGKICCYRCATPERRHA